MLMGFKKKREKSIPSIRLFPCIAVSGVVGIGTTKKNCYCDSEGTLRVKRPLNVQLKKREEVAVINKGDRPAG